MLIFYFNCVYKAFCRRASILTPHKQHAILYSYKYSCKRLLRQDTCLKSMSENLLQHEVHFQDVGRRDPKQDDNSH